MIKTSILLVHLFVAIAVTFAQANVISPEPISSSKGAGNGSMFRGGPQHTGKYEGSGFSAKNRTLWRFKTGGAVQSSSAIQAGLLYVGSNDGYLYCIVANSGMLKWKFKATAGITSSPAVAFGL